MKEETVTSITITFKELAKLLRVKKIRHVYREILDKKIHIEVEK